MFTSRHRVSAVVVGSFVALIMAAPIAPASAEGLFDLLFKPSQRQAPAPAASPYADPTQPAEAAVPRVERSPSVSYCVRLCDGKFFPIQRSAATPAQVCSSFCPAAKTKIFSGSGIDHATARDGTRYADLASAFAYRPRVVDGCTCNGKDGFGLVNMQAAEDPTLRPGDIVATSNGLAAYGGGRKAGADFTPIGSYSGVSAEMRKKLADTKVAPAAAVAAPAPKTDLKTVNDGEGKRAQLTR